MAEKFSFFDPVYENGVYDREYNAQEFTDYFNTLITTGVMKGVGNQLEVTANGANMITKVNTGVAFIEARRYLNDIFKEHTHDTESLGNSRIDRIVVRMDLNPDKRHVLSFIKKGTPSPNPVAPVLTQTTDVYEISLAQVKIVGGNTFIATNAVTDERGTNVICPWAGSNILPSFDDNVLQEHILEYEAMLKIMVNDGKFAWDTTDNRGGAIDPAFGINIDTIDRTGFFWGSKSWGTSGTTPSTSSFYLLNIQADGYLDNGYQIAFMPSRNSDNDDSSMMQRTKTGGAWQPWRPFGGVWTDWVDIPLQSGWVKTAGFVKYRRKGNMVQIVGNTVVAKSGYSPNMAQIPLSIFPTDSMAFTSIASGSTETFIQLKLLSNGYISVFPVNNTNLTTYTNGMYFSVTYMV